MSVGVTTVKPTDRRIRFHNGFAWFLDEIFEPYLPVPAHLFGQGAGPSADGPGPGDLDPIQSLAFAQLIDSLSDGELEDRMWIAMNGRDAGDEDDPMAAAIATVRELAELARFAAEHGGLHIH